MFALPSSVYYLSTMKGAVSFVTYLKMKSLEAFRERQWNVVQVVVSDIKMLQFIQILEEDGKKRGNDRHI